MTKLKFKLKATLLALLSLCIVACGDTSPDTFVNGNSGNLAGAANFIGNFLGANRLAGGQTATLNMNVAQGGAATGNVVVANAPVVTQAIMLPVGSVPFTGNVDPSTGAFSLNGTFPGVGPFTITGVLSVGGNAGTYTINVNGTAFQGVVQPASQGTPTLPPVGGGNSQVISGGTLSNFVFTPAGNFNGDNPPVSGTSIIAGALANGQTGPQSLSLVLTESELAGQTVRLRTFAITIVDQNADIQAGTTYPLASGNPPNGAVIALSESVGTNVEEGYSLVNGTTGQVTVTSITPNSVTVDFQFTGVGPNSEVTNNPSTGTFSTSGTITGNFAQI